MTSDKAKPGKRRKGEKKAREKNERFGSEPKKPFPK
jgi:hypothetical protein